MDFQTAVRTCLQQKYAEFNGRASRPEFWWFFLFTWLVGQIASLLDNAVGGPSSGNWYDPKFTLFNSLVNLALLLPSLAVGVRRLRDAGKSPWNLAWVLLPFIGWIVLVVQLASPSMDQQPQFPPQQL
jgi:uncharacterized membrane protein YhaH (DUF805 family)